MSGLVTKIVFAQPKCYIKCPAQLQTEPDIFLSVSFLFLTLNLVLPYIKRY